MYSKRSLDYLQLNNLKYLIVNNNIYYLKKLT